MKTFKKIALSLLIIFSGLLIGGYIYFECKFSPPANTLTVSGNSGNIPIKWSKDGENNYAALLLPVRLKNIDKILYMQLDTGSPTTVFYQKALESIHLKSIEDFTLDTMKVSASEFPTINYGKEMNFENPTTPFIIGTIGNDLLEKRIVILDFKNKRCSFTDSINENGFSNFQFKKRKILIPAKIGNENLKLMYDSGTSGYELITHKEQYEKYRIPKSKTKQEKGNSWGKILTIYSSSTNQKITLANTPLPISQITYIEGVPEIQQKLMKFSGMKGMLGNKIFLNHSLILDSKREKFSIK